MRESTALSRKISHYAPLPARKVWRCQPLPPATGCGKAVEAYASHCPGCGQANTLVPVPRAEIPPPRLGAPRCLFKAPIPRRRAPNDGRFVGGDGGGGFDDDPRGPGGGGDEHGEGDDRDDRDDGHGPPSFDPPPETEEQTRERLRDRPPAIALSKIKVVKRARILTGVSYLDRVAGAKNDPGFSAIHNAILVGGPPGVGKSTSVVMALAKMAKRGKVVYGSGEEGNEALAAAGQRVGAKNLHRFLAVATTNLDHLLEQAEMHGAVAVAIDSIQMFTTNACRKPAGSMLQLVAVAKHLYRWSQAHPGVLVFVVCHVVKDGDIAGPKAVAHELDVILMFEPVEGQDDRMVLYCRGKNRGGMRNVRERLRMTDEGRIVAMKVRGSPRGSAPTHPSGATPKKGVAKKGKRKKVKR